MTTGKWIAALLTLALLVSSFSMTAQAATPQGDGGRSVSRTFKNDKKADEESVPDVSASVTFVIRGPKEAREATFTVKVTVTHSDGTKEEETFTGTVGGLTEGPFGVSGTTDFGNGNGGSFYMGMNGQTSSGTMTYGGQTYNMR